MNLQPVQAGLLQVPQDPAAVRLRGSRCATCDQIAFPEQQSCPYCAGAACQPVLLSPRGTLELCTTVHNRPPGYEGPLPFGFGVVALPDGIRLISRIVLSEHLHLGDAVKLVIETLQTDEQGNQTVTYAFARAAD